MTVIRICRTERFSKSIGGRLLVDGDFVCYTLERPWRRNEKNVSCIPAGTYACFWRHDRDRVQVESIPCPGGRRVGIQIHAGNAPSDTQGCILVGTSTRANWVSGSKAAMRQLEGAIWGEEYGPGYGSKPMTLRVEGVLMNSIFDDLDTTPWSMGRALG